MYTADYAYARSISTYRYVAYIGVVNRATPAAPPRISFPSREAHLEMRMPPKKAKKHMANPGYAARRFFARTRNDGSYRCISPPVKWVGDFVALPYTDLASRRI